MFFFRNGEHTTINLYSMDLHEDNPVSAETSLPLLDHSILDVLEFTPVCVVCTICNRPINGTVGAVKLHMSKHFIIPNGTQFRIGNQLQLGMEHAKQENVATLLQGTEEIARLRYECVDCKTLMKSKKQIEEHQARSSTCIVGTEPREVPCFLLPNGCTQNDPMPMGWYISLHTIGIGSHLLA